MAPFNAGPCRTKSRQQAVPDFRYRRAEALRSLKFFMGAVQRDVDLIRHIFNIALHVWSS
jgi:hypothetical protein